jgi:SHS2 domain-containing protein
VASAPTAHWEHFLHDADIGVRGIGPTLAAAFEQAALAMAAVPDLFHLATLPHQHKRSR